MKVLARFTPQRKDAIEGLRYYRTRIYRETSASKRIFTKTEKGTEMVRLQGKSGESTDQGTV